MSSTSPPSFILQNPSNPVISSLLHTLPLAISTPSNLRFPPLTRTFLVNTSKPRNFSSQPLYDAVSQPQLDEYDDDDDDSAIGDCLVYEDGIFDDPLLQSALNSRNDDVSSPIRKSNSKDTTEVPAENLIPEKWLDVQREINISKKERRKLSQELEYGKRVEKRRQALMPLNSNSEAFERFKNEKLQQLKPLVLDEPEPPQNSEEVGSDNKSEEKRGGGDDERRSEEVVVSGRVAPRNPRLAVYGGGLEDISAVFSSGDYDPGASEKSQGTRKLFSKEEKSLLNRRVPDLAVAISGKWHPLHTLAASGEFYLVNSLLKHNIDINVPDKNGLTAIHKAILGRKQAIFNYLLRESANPFIRDNEGATLMHYAVFSASAQMVKILLLYNVNINLQDNDGWTPLHLAVQSRRTDVIRLLLIKGADKSIKNRNGLTALDLCLYSGRDTRTYEVIKLLKLLPKPSLVRNQQPLS
ncbi:ankyrin repeat domain-containing protein chloroplastic [Phtheirospermum japonicum]|uniref:Ankyrin repeat domain-containing protein chloroplastic n=1 Tax=Phtheirospermum japonicum TaxID=374723 RepID=A0A830D6W7_9LAMI|nr:ankyrin repeat domain-containing protein chloroplastic [Phtheirospermum japonicum]